MVIIAISASVLASDRQKSTQAGANEFIAKPVHLSELLGLIQTYLQLDWIFDGHEPKSEEAEIGGPAPAPEDMIAPPRDAMDELFDCVQRGNISAILEKAESFEKMDERYVPFANELRRLAKSFKVKKIREFVKLHMA